MVLATGLSIALLLSYLAPSICEIIGDAFNLSPSPHYGGVYPYVVMAVLVISWFFAVIIDIALFFFVVPNLLNENSIGNMNLYWYCNVVGHYAYYVIVFKYTLIGQMHEADEESSWLMLIRPIAYCVNVIFVILVSVQSITGFVIIEVIPVSICYMISISIIALDRAYSIICSFFEKKSKQT